MLSITLVLLTLGLSPETGLYVNGQAEQNILDKAILIEELQARLPGLQVTSLPTQDQGRFYTLEFSQNTADGKETKLLFILKDADKNILLKRSLRPSQQTLATARQIALVIEGVIKRRGDSLSEILLAQKPDPEPVTVIETETPEQQKALQLDAAMTFGTIISAKRSTIGMQFTAQTQVWQSLYLGVQGGFQHLLNDGNRGPNAGSIELFEWNSVGLAKWQYMNAHLGFSVLTGVGIAVSLSEASNDASPVSFGETDTLLLIRAGLELSWEISNDFSMLGVFSADFTPNYPRYNLEGQNLLNRGSTSIFASAGFRYSPF